MIDFPCFRTYRARTMKTTFLFLGGTLLALSAGADTDHPDAVALVQGCAACHGTEGRGGGVAPILSGLPPDRFLQAMRDFRSGKRAGGAMNRIAPGYDEAELAAMAQFFGGH